MTLEFNQVASVGVNVVSPETDAADVAFSAAADQIGGVDAPLRPRGRRLIALRQQHSQLCDWLLNSRTNDVVLWKH